MSSLRIFVADDHDLIREGLKAILKAQPGWQVVGEAFTGRQAVTEAIRLRPDVVVMDIGLPELNGLDATRQIIRSLPQTEVLIVTMHESEEFVYKVLETGARGYVLKTNATRYLVNAVASLAEHTPFLVPYATQVLLNGHLNSSQRKETPHGAKQLSEREREIVQLLVDGKRTKEIAAAAGISVRTAATHKTNILRKLDLHATAELVRYAILNKIALP